MLNVLIMAGGKGTRFWPLSTDEKPKQFLKLIDERTMIQATVNRLRPLVELNHIFICTGKQYVSIVEEQLPDLPKRNIIIEPTGRNTAPCILLSTLYINQIYKSSQIVVLPSDHMINDENKFLDILRSGNQFLLNENKDAIITIGITPNRPETGYGYINYDSEIISMKNHVIMKVKKFIEKPNTNKANEYLKDGHYLWNAGMFMFDVSFILDEFKKYYTSFEILNNLPSIENADYYSELEKKYCQCEAISVDYAIMERSDSIYVIPSDFGWDDIGTWKALERYITKDENNNILKGNIKQINANENIAYGNDREIILYGVNDIFCIDTGEKIIIGKKENLTKIHELRGK